MDKLEALGFKNLHEEDLGIFKEHFLQWDKHYGSSLSFNSMLAWNHSIPIYFKIVEEYIICVANDTPTKRWVMLPPIGEYNTNGLDSIIQTMLDMVDELGIDFVMTDISEWMFPYFQILTDLGYTYNHEEGLSDYIYQKADFLDVLKHQKIRYAYNHFLRKQEPEVVVLTQQDQDEIVEFTKDNWCGDGPCSFCTYGCMADAIYKLVSVLDKIDAKGIKVYSNKKLIGMALVSIEQDQLFFQFKFVLHGIRGINEFIHKECVERFGETSSIINYTEDMDKPGLRSFKQRLAPYTLAHKYELSKPRVE